VSEDRLVSAQWVADFLGVPKSWVYDAARERRLPSVPVGRYVRFDPAAIRAWVEANAVAARGAGP
jgi:excisionase family DNA binding protein